VVWPGLKKFPVVDDVLLSLGGATHPVAATRRIIVIQQTIRANFSFIFQ
jgi:hypothetical protein